jgi:CDP-glycerol glycerophosphotransferase (TagB/SpsB family)
LEHPEIRSVWITKDKEIYDRLKKDGFPVVKANSIRGFILQLKAGVAVLTSGKYDVSQNLLTGRTKIIQLWHGIPLKKIGFDTYLAKINDRLVRYLFFLPVLKNLLKFDLLISTSEFIKQRFMSSFRLSGQKVPVTGYPRNDILFSNSAKLDSNNGVRTILYAPTLRNEGTGGSAVEKLGIEELSKVNSFLTDINAKLYIKLHFSEEDLLKDINLSNIVLLRSDPFFDIQEFLCRTDVLITDYSSVYFDYLLLDRPIVFFAYDLENYIKNDRGFYDQYEDVTPGYIVRSWDEVEVSIKKYLAEPDRYQEERKKLTEKYWGHFDGKSSERVYSEIMKVLKK